MMTQQQTVDMLAAQAKFFDLSLDIQLVLDHNGIILLCNSAFAKIFNHAPADIIGTPFLQYIGGQTDTMMDNLNAITEAARPLSLECAFSHFDGSLHHYVITVYPQSDDCCHVIGKDITPYREMENRESERNIFAEALLDTVLTINTSLALEQVLERILANIGKVVAYDDVTIILVNDQRAEVVGSLRKHPYHLDVTLNSQHVLTIADHALLAEIYTSHNCLILPKVDQPPQWMTSHHSHHSGSFLGAPIVVDENVIGFLGIFNMNSEFFTPLHAQQIITFANQAGIALQNARLYEQAQSVAILRERQRMAQEIHDSVNQELFAASTYADLLPKAIDRKPELVAQYALDVSRLVRSAVEQMRMILIELHPDALTKTRLDTLIERLCDVLAKRIDIVVNCLTNEPVVLNERDQVAFYRITQEALHNIEKHAQATQVTVELITEADAVQLTIHDDGIGFDTQDIPDMHFGVSSMHDRAASIGASLELISEVGQGTTIIVRKAYP